MTVKAQADDKHRTHASRIGAMKQHRIPSPAPITDAMTSGDGGYAHGTGMHEFVG